MSYYYRQEWHEWESLLCSWCERQGLLAWVIIDYVLLCLIIDIYLLLLLQYSLFCIWKEIMLNFVIGFLYVHLYAFDNLMLWHINLLDLRNYWLCWDVILMMLFLLSMYLGYLLTHMKIIMLNFITALSPK